ncbi:Ubiquitin-conjugating enzyme E2 J1 [Cichlidogyrus casuarinus]|uniref:Ubiquitin-conjugating enzyme E2 J1 n=1 Tax=Cichlidogyrus casuarinus TaxID=1844966 RepID=A0ABD2PZ52_9PLAT
MVSVKRLMKEASDLSKSTELYFAQPSEDNLFEWHFTIRGPSDTEFDGGIYHGRIILPPDYPMKPPNIIFSTENGRFETHRRICLSISSYHPESWRPSWSIRTALLAIIGFMASPGMGAIGSLEYPKEERQKLAKQSSSFKCESCGSIKDLLLPLTDASKDDIQEAKERASEVSLSARDDQGEMAGEPVTPCPVKTKEDIKEDVENKSPKAVASQNPPAYSAPSPQFSGILPNGNSTNPPFWICFPYYPNGVPGMNPLFFPTMSNIVSPDQPGPMSFEEFLKKKKEQEPVQTEASTSQPRSSTCAAVPETAKKEVKPEPKVEAPSAPPTACDGDTDVDAEAEKAKQVAQSMFEKAALIHRQRAERMGLTTPATPSTSTSNEQIPRVAQQPRNQSRVQFMFLICATLLCYLIMKRFLLINLTLDWEEDELEPEL